MDKSYISLSALQDSIADTVGEVFGEAVWVKAEIASMSVARGGHCYMDISESVGGKVVAQARAIAWSSIFRQIAPYFESVTGTPLTVGQQVLLSVNVQYSPLYGLSLIIDDIDPDYTLGDAERKRMETLERLQKEKLAGLQSGLELPFLPCRLAVISAETAAGYRDFLRHLHENEYGYRFYTRLFPAAMQGADCPESVASAIADVLSCGEKFDAVLILRGGGGKLDLACFDEYEICKAVALCPIPVLTAIGHDQDTHLCDMMAYDSVKTPTALADYFLDLFGAFDASLDALTLRLRNAGMTRLALMESVIDALAARVEAADPRRLLERGFVMVLGNDGRPLRNTGGSMVGDSLQVRLADGTLNCEIKSVERYNG